MSRDTASPPATGGLPEERELNDETLRWCGRFSARGLKAGDRVVVLSHNRPELLPALYAAWRLGLVWVPLNARLSAAELQPLCDRATPSLCISEDALRDRLAGAVSLQALAAEEAEATTDAPSLAPSADAALLYTSGTTGVPKGAVLTRGAFIAAAKASAQNLGSGPGGWLLCMPLFHVGGLAMALRRTCTTRRLVAAGALRRGEGSSRRCTTTEPSPSSASCPTQLRFLLDAARPRRRHSLRAVLVGGGPVPKRAAHARSRRGWPVLQTYGLTEACSQVATERPGEGGRDLRRHPLPGTELRITDGEIQVRGPTLLSRYLPPHEAPFTPDGWLPHRRSRESSTRRAAARCSRVAWTSSSPAERTSTRRRWRRCSAAHPEVADAAVVPVPDDTWGQTAVALWAPRNGDGAPALADWCRQRLAGFKVPRHFIAVPQVPRNATGKVDRARARALAESHVGQAQTRTGEVHMSSAAD